MVSPDVTAKALEQVRSTCNPLHARLMVTCCALWLNEDDVMNALRHSLDDQIAALIEYVQLKMGTFCCGHILSCINQSRFGLSQMEILDILSSDIEFLKSLYCYVRPECQPVVPLHIWLQTKMILKPLLRDYVIEGTTLINWRNGVTSDVIRDMFDLGVVTSIQSIMLNYFTDKERICPANSKIIKSNPRRFEQTINRRLLSESVWLMVLEHRVEDLDNTLFSADFLIDKLQTCGLYEVLHDVGLMLRLVPGDADVVMLQKVLHHCNSMLAADAAHLPAVLYLLQKEGELVTDGQLKMQQLIETLTDTSCPLTPFLIPHDPSVIQDFTLLSTCHTGEVPPSKWQGFHRILDHPQLMAGISTNCGEVIIWDINKLSVIRKLMMLKLPRDMRPITSTRAVVLCDRELCLINLDEGRLENKLKGVLNLKMPYYSIHNNEHVIALSRNRMYLNLINTTTGDVVTTFKAGEDR